MKRDNHFRPDAFLLLSYGGPENRADIGPFLDRVLAGKPIPTARRAAVEEKYRAFHGKSPLNGEVRRFLARLRVYLTDHLDETDPRVPIYTGNLYTAPFLDDVLAEIAADGRQRIRVLITHAFGTPTGCLRYRRALAEAIERFERRFSSAEKPAMNWRFSFVEPFFDSPRFHSAVADTLLSASASIRLEQEVAERLDDHLSSKNPRYEDSVFVLFSAHALPSNESAMSGYEAQLLSVCEKVAATTGLGKRWSPDFTFEPDSTQKTTSNGLWRWNLVYQSRSGPSSQSWSEPSIGPFLRQIKTFYPNFRDVLVIPVGFFFENMETVGDLDNDFAKICADNGVRYWRAGAVGGEPEAVGLAANLLMNGPSSAFYDDSAASKSELNQVETCMLCGLRCKGGKK